MHCTGEAPWWHKEQKELQRKIAHTKLRLPTFLTGECKTLLRGLLTKDPAARLGVTEACDAFTADWNAVQKHAFFRGMNFTQLARLKLEAPFIPTLSSSLSVENFDSKYTLEAPVLSPLRKVRSPREAGGGRGGHSVASKFLRSPLHMLAHMPNMHLCGSRYPRIWKSSSRRSL